MCGKVLGIFETLSLCIGYEPYFHPPPLLGPWAWISQRGPGVTSKGGAKLGKTAGGLANDSPSASCNKKVGPRKTRQASGGGRGANSGKQGEGATARGGAMTLGGGRRSKRGRWPYQGKQVEGFSNAGGKLIKTSGGGKG